MELVLKVNNNDRLFIAPFISARMLRKTIEISTRVNLEKPDVSMIDVMVDYIVDLYGKQFTRDEFYDGIEANKLIATLINCINEVTGQLNEKLEPLKDPNA